MSKKAFSLIELLIYVSIFAVVAGLMTSILVTILKVSQKESASIETSEQLSFVMQTVSRLIRESSNIETASADSLKLRMKDSAKDPTCLYRENQIIKLAEGPDSPNNNDNCTPTASNLTSSKVIADKLEFSKITNYPGHDVVSIDIQLIYNSSNPQSQITRNLKSAIARVSAATFDDNLIPGSDAKYDLGFSPNTRWKDANFSGNLLVGGNVGIGTVNPGVLLQVEKSGGAVASFPTLGAASGNLALIGNAGGWGMYLGLDDSGPGWIQQMRNDSAVAYNLVLQPVGGNVGIGTTNPSNKLTIRMPVAVGSNSLNTSNVISNAGFRTVIKTDGSLPETGFMFGDSSGVTNDFWIQVGKELSAGVLSTGYPLLINPLGGYVGIGTTNPNVNLDARGVVALGNTGNRFVVGQRLISGQKGVWLTVDDVASNVAGIQAENAGTGYFNMAIQPYGSYVGIGAPEPRADIEVNGGLKVSGQIDGSHGQKNCYWTSMTACYDGAITCNSGYFVAGAQTINDACGAKDWEGTKLYCCQF